ncbi:cysteine-rich and transmembrane domain-containing protein 1 [Sciurus carolinensis]|uniref:cysteine-rich and transmembrane domain-containing protein 1 n=1 Tax=Sciurus carolinensis TaxID=30640 RepID=UPI001FB35B82|nr:cysteine-rich and transmembrane domain-containing protein 1 [Sciurus carolinensis]XP_047412050.1 cysteine-rich and transmembrane domain-containing protein 1 [Sciurus carolinensis]XP_047412051.1 cysteine-rich and transmembrane domain-containing protein 1 [Sciurus carolinensis]XP_047412052.1 cysteine-rich and transmembrane domain-containing protein 1 [Sciurus carolinensis]XP_047412053.1 cysteine-rich and transmembrane domain-containing protein 1 [Sciurus carolinensis]
MNRENPPPYPGPGPTAPYPPYPQQPMGPMAGPYPPPQGYPYPGYPQYGWQGGPQEPPKTTGCFCIFVKPVSPVQCMWWKTKEEMTWAHPPASQPAGLLSVAAASGTCLPDQTSPPASTIQPPPPIGVPTPFLLIAVISD